jgi:aubergine-like protein
MANQHSNLQILVFILPRPDSNLYTAIKRTCCCELAIPSQVVTKKNVAPNQPKTMSVVTKVAIQMSCKIGGSPWGILVPVIVQLFFHNYLTEIFLRKYKFLV